jgi:hypothetical protein
MNQLLNIYHYLNMQGTLQGAKISSTSWLPSKSLKSRKVGEGHKTHTRDKQVNSTLSKQLLREWYQPQ